MPGGLLQIVAYGAQDMYLTYNPQITFFKIVYRRHTNFSMQTFEYDVLDGPNFGLRSIHTLNRTGDLIGSTYLKVVIPSIIPNGTSKFAWTRRLGHAILDVIEIKIGGQTIDRNYGIWLDIWFELTYNSRKEEGYLRMIGDTPELTTLSNTPKPQYEIYIPLKFWFCKYIGLALPIIAIQYHQIEFNMVFNSALSLGIYDGEFDTALLTGASLVGVSLMIDNIYLDEVERNLFATNGHEYLIEQVQYTGEDSANKERTQFDLQFNHPTKELIWVLRRGIYTSGNTFLNYTNKKWNSTFLLETSITLLKNSILLLEPTIYELDSYGNKTIIAQGELPPNDGDWEEIESNTTQYTMNEKILITNNSSKSFWINTNSLIIVVGNSSYSITGKICGKILIGDDEIITIIDVASDITVRDLSFPITAMTDTRASSNDIVVNLHGNYGIFIDGTYNPISYTKLEYNRQERFEKRNWRFFGVLQPEMHHTRTPVDGVNVYSFALHPEEHQPSGTSNLSRVEHEIMTMFFKDTTLEGYDLNYIDEPIIDVLDLNNRVFVFGLSYNILRISNGLVGIAYNG